MITSADLKLIADRPDPNGLGIASKIVEYNGRVFSLLVQDMDPNNDEQMAKIMQADPYFGFIILMSGERQVQTWVTEEKWDNVLQEWVPLYECDDTCDGVQCRKAVAKTHEVADADLAEKMLLDYLNA
jgi:hypothetical protein